jgi:hypothetical protein
VSSFWEWLQDDKNQHVLTLLGGAVAFLFTAYVAIKNLPNSQKQVPVAEEIKTPADQSSAARKRRLAAKRTLSVSLLVSITFTVFAVVILGGGIIYQMHYIHETGFARMPLELSRLAKTLRLACRCFRGRERADFACGLECRGRGTKD